TSPPSAADPRRAAGPRDGPAGRAVARRRRRPGPRGGPAGRNCALSTDAGGRYRCSAHNCRRVARGAWRARPGVSDVRGLLHAVAGDAHHLLALDDLDAGAGLTVGVHRGGAERLLVLVQRHPAVPRRVLHAAVLEQAQDRVLLPLGRGGEGAGLDVLEQARDRLDRVGLRRPDQADGAALEPAVGVDAGEHGAVRLGDAAGDVVDHAAAGIVRDAGQLGAVVADGAVDGAQRVVDHLAGALEVALGIQAGALEAHAGDRAVLAEHLDGAVPEVHVEAAPHGTALAVGGLLAGGLAALLLLEPAHEGLDDLVGALVRLDGLPLGLGDLLDVARVHHDL